MTEEAYPQGMDCIWLAADRNDCVAAFATAGSGLIPLKLLEVEHDAIGAIEERIEKLPRTSTARLLVSMRRPDNFVGIAERGIIAYDWSDVHRTKREEIGAYELIAAPSKPSKLGELPHDMAALVAYSRLQDVAFESADRLDVRKLLSCAEAP